MSKYKVYLPVVLILLLFFSLVFFQDTLVGYMSQSKMEQLSTVAKNTMAEYITKNFDYAVNDEEFEYTFLEFGSIGCHACRQMEGVMEEIKSKHGNRVKVVFVNVMKKENHVLADFFGVAVIPMQVLLNKNGKEYFRHTGFISAPDLALKFP